MDIKFKNVQLPEGHEFNEEHLKFLKTLDDALEKSKEGISKKEDIDKVKAEMDKNLDDLKKNLNYEELKKSINDVYVQLSDRPMVGEKEKDAAMRRKNEEWIRTFLRKDRAGLKSFSTEFKTQLWPAHVMHTGENENIDAGSDAQGGYLIPELFTNEIHRWVQESGVARREMRYLPFSGPGNTRRLHRLLTDVSVSWVDEGATKPKTKPTTEYVNQTLKTVAAIVIFTEEIIEDAAVDLISFCSQLLGEAIAFEEDSQFLAGTGAPWTGVINDAAVTPVAMAATELAEDVSPDDFLECIMALSSAQKRGAKFYMHPTVHATIMGYRASAVAAGDGEGPYLYQHASESSPARLWGYPIVESDALPAISDADAVDTPFAFFANLQRTSIYGDKQGIRMKVLDQATVTDSDGTLVNLAEQDMLALRVHKRVGYVNILPDGIAVLQTGPVS